MKSRVVIAASIASLIFIDQSLAGTVTTVVVDNSAGAADASGPGNSTTGYITNDIIIDSQGAGILSQQLLINLTGGPPNPIYQHSFGNNVAPFGPPNHLLAGIAPGILYDTYLAAGTASTAVSTALGATVAGKSQDLGGPGGAGPAVFSTTDIDAAWGAVGAMGSNYLSARITLHSTVVGTFSYRVNYDDGTSNIILDGIIQAGCLGFHCGGQDFVIDDLFLGGTLPGSLITGGPLPTTDVDEPDSVAWSLVSLIGPDGAEVGATVDPLTGVFSWQSAPTDSRGTYTATIQGVNADPNTGTDTGRLTFNLVPEPASMTLLGLAMVGALGFLRRR